MNKLLKPVLATLALTIPAFANADVDTKQVSVNEVVITYNTVDAASSYGMLELEKQIRRAAEQVCGPQGLSSGRTGSLREVMDNRECYRNAVAKALDTVSKTA